MTTTPPAPAPTGHTDAGPCPRVLVLVSPMPADADTVTVWRAYPGAAATIVRGANAASVSGDFEVVDYEAPLGVDVTYTCQTADVDGIPSETSPSSPAVNLDVAELWLSDPLAPGTSLPVQAPWDGSDTTLGLTANSLQSVTYAGQGSTAPVVGSKLPFAFADTRQAASSTTLEVACADVDLIASLLSLISQAFPICVRRPAGMRLLDPLTYAAVGDVVRSYAAPSGLEVWALPVTAVRAPGSGIVVPVRTYADLLNEAGTYAELASLYISYLNLQQGVMGA